MQAWEPQTLFKFFFHLSSNRAMLQVLQGQGHPLESVFASGSSMLRWLLVGAESQPSSLELSPKHPQLWVFWTEFPTLKAWATFNDFTQNFGWACLIWHPVVLFCYAWITVWIYLQLSLLPKNVALRQCHRPNVDLMIFLWYLDSLLGLSLILSCRVICATGPRLVSSSQVVHPDRPTLGLSFQQLSWWNAWHCSAQACPRAKINMQYVLWGFIELTPKYLFTQMLTFSWVMGKAPRTHCWWQSRIRNPTQNFGIGQGCRDCPFQPSHFRIRKTGLQAVNNLPIKTGIGTQVFHPLDQFLLSLLKKWMPLGETAPGACIIRWVMVKAASQIHTLGLETTFPNPFCESYMKKPQTQDSSQKQWFSSPSEILDGCLTQQRTSRLQWQTRVSTELWGWCFKGGGCVCESESHTVGHVLLSTGWVRAREYEGNVWKGMRNDVPLLTWFKRFSQLTEKLTEKLYRETSRKIYWKRDISLFLRS